METEKAKEVLAQTEQVEQEELLADGERKFRREGSAIMACNYTEHPGRVQQVARDYRQSAARTGTPSVEERLSHTLPDDDMVADLPHKKTKVGSQGHQSFCYDVRWLLLRWIDTRISSPVLEFDDGDTESVAASVQDTSGEEDSPVEKEVTQSPAIVFGKGGRAALRELDEVELEAEFITRACVMMFPLFFLRGQYRSAMRFALQEAQASPRRIDSEGPVAGTVHRFCCGSMGPPPRTKQKVR